MKSRAGYKLVIPAPVPAGQSGSAENQVRLLAVQRYHASNMTVQAATLRHSCSFLEISNLRFERACESGPRRAALDVGCQTPVAGDDVGVLEDAQDRGQHKIAGRKAITIEKGLGRTSTGSGAGALR
jgi:hypothetical protein